MALSEPELRQILRIIDANLNRVGEGLRVLEDVARLLLDDQFLSQRLKNLRHGLVRSDRSFQERLLQSRSSDTDVGANLEVPGEEKGRELPLMIVANARRVQESLRTLEEVAKVPGITAQLDSEKFKQARFNLYSLEQQLLFKLGRKDKLQGIFGLYIIIDTPALRGRSHYAVASQAIAGGARVIQLRDKTMGRRELLPIAQQLRDLCAERKVLFIMNDYLDLALATDADGLHVGQEDLPFSAARRLLPRDKILGCSTTTVEQALAALAEGADYIAVGAMYPTSSKEKATVVGLERLHQVRQAVSCPLVAIGGITRDNAAEVVAAGADAVAIISAVVSAESPEEASRQIVASLKTKK